MLLDGTRSFQGSISSSLYSVDLGTLTVGSHAMDGTYSGDSNYKGKMLSSVPLTVTKADTSIALSTSAATVVYGSNVTITIDRSTSIQWIADWKREPMGWKHLDELGHSRC